MLNQNEERLQKALARAGVASRRACEELIAAGRVRVNGKIVTQLGVKIDPTTDKVSVDDQPIAIRPSLAPSKVYLMLNKPAGYLSTVSDPQGRSTIMDLINSNQRLYPVGRLDMDTEGLLILTNDGTFANTLMHPRYGLEKEYLALVDGMVAAHEVEQLRRGVSIPVEDDKSGEREQYVTLPARVDIVRKEGSNTLLRFVIKEGKKRQVRLMVQAIHRPVLELRRVRFGSLRLGDLVTGKYRALSKVEVKELLDAASKVPTATPKQAQARPEQKPVRFNKVDNGFSPNRRFAAKGEESSDERREPGRPLRRPSPNSGYSQAGPAEKRYSGGRSQSGPSSNRGDFRPARPAPTNTRRNSKRSPGR